MGGWYENRRRFTSGLSRSQKTYRSGKSLFRAMKEIGELMYG